jgi:hypothetical protein
MPTTGRGEGKPMLAHHMTFEAEEVAHASRENALWWVVETLRYLRTQALPVEDWVRFVGQEFAPSWEGFRGKELAALGREVALNIVSSGGRIESFTEQTEGVETVEIVAWWPTEEDLQRAKLIREEFGPLYAIFDPIAAHIGIACEHEVREGRWVLRFSW